MFVVAAQLTDNGDGDRWADTNETVGMQITVYNAMGFDLTGVTARIRTESPAITCIVDDTVDIGDLAVGEFRELADGFTFLVADVHRPDLESDLSAEFEVDMTADQFEALPEAEKVFIDLDLDALGGSQPTVFFEGFESGFGQFTEMQIDANLNPPESDLGNAEAGLFNADGYRCQYADPDWEGSLSFYSSTSETCYPSPNGSSDQSFFSGSDERSHSGTRSLYYGLLRYLEFTTPLAQLEAMVTTDPINLAWDHVCELTRTTTCTGDLDCPVAEACVLASSSLRFKHQISLVDHRAVQANQFESLDRAVVQVQPLDRDGSPAGPWQTVQAHRNAYDTQHTVKFPNCFFDPVDDGNAEEDFFDPADPSRLLGPSSTCYPERNFVHQGDTDDLFDATNIGDATGPGLEGEAGMGTWVEPVFSLARFAGRRVRLRFLISTVKVGFFVTWQEVGLGPYPEDDGWWIDDIEISDTLLEPAAVTVDTNANLEIKDDADLDGIGAICDCDPADETVWMVPSGVTDVRLSHVGGVGGSTTISWTQPADPGALVVVYDTLRSPLASDFTGAATACLESDDGSDTLSTDALTPAPGLVHYFLVRAEHRCGEGPIGTASSGTLRVAVACP